MEPRRECDGLQQWNQLINEERLQRQQLKRRINDVTEVVRTKRRGGTIVEGSISM